MPHASSLSGDAVFRSGHQSQEQGIERSAANRILALGIGEFSAWLGNRAAEFARTFDPFVDDNFGIHHGFGASLAVGHAAGQFGHFDNEAVVVLAPINDEFVANRFRRNSSHVPMTVNAPMVA